MAFSNFQPYNLQTQINPSLRLVKEPQEVARFRYESEKTKHDIHAKGSTKQDKVNVLIQVDGYIGNVLIEVSCVGANDRWFIHPHKLDGSNCTADGICRLRASPVSNMTAELQNVGIKCVTNNDIKHSLTIRYNAFRWNDPIKKEKSLNDLMSREKFIGDDSQKVRLHFQGFLVDEGFEPLNPINSGVITNLKHVKNLRIVYLSHCCSQAEGNQEVVLLCDKINLKGIEVVFFETDVNNIRIWERNAEIVQTHQDSSIVFKTPQYHSTNITTPVNVFVQLRNSREQNEKYKFSEALPFQYIPSKPLKKAGNKVHVLDHLVKFLQEEPTADKGWFDRRSSSRDSFISQSSGTSNQAENPTSIEDLSSDYYTSPLPGPSNQAQDPIPIEEKRITSDEIINEILDIMTSNDQVMDVDLPSDELFSL